LFGGQKLKPSDILENVGVEDGSVMNVVPATKKKKSSGSASSSGPAAAVVDESGAISADGAPPLSNPSFQLPNMDEMLKQSGLDPAQFQDMLSSEGMPDMQQSMQMIQEMINSPLFQNFLNDPEKMEESRKMILENPLMKGMMSSLPGFEEILSDKEAFRETMLEAAKMYQEMGKDGAGMFGGAFEGFGEANPNSALDDLSEGED